ncbi:ATP-dependent DNA helicase RecG [Corynebacterium sp. A21]|uniref:ATP-dependent DNA helicase RecG n=1 Tax=Corynebacterium sp. A21 TaxID=3457318 RepID=UPI003FD580B3
MLGWSDARKLAEILPAKEATAIKKAFGYTTAAELLDHYARGYSRHGSGVNVEDAAEGDIVTCVGEVTWAHTSYTSTGKLMHRIVISDGRNTLTASFFQAKFPAKQLVVGVRAMFSGKLGYYRGTPQISHPDYLLLPTAGSTRKQISTGGLRNLSAYGDAADVDALLAERDYIAVYPAKKGMTSWRLMGAVHQVLATLPPVEEPLGFTPAGLVSFDDAIRGIHEPGPEGPEIHRRRMKYNEALSLAIVMALRRADTEHRKAPACTPVSGGQQEQLRAGLPFPLTKGQQVVIGEITTDLQANTPMSRLLQGEVGSGKTVVALLGMLQVVDAERQCAMLAPTEVLAIQHGRSLTALLSAAGVAASVVVLTGSMPVAQKRKALLDIVSGQADIVVGTHALIQDTVEFFDLGMVVVDEQHRFGVEQRDRLRGKGRDEMTPHLLVMTATPIPRTIAMTVFGDLTVSTLRELPGGRKPIQSTVVPELLRPKWMARALDRIREEVANGHQAYVVCPRIENEGGVLAVYESLSKYSFQDLTVGVLHGRMSGEDKDRVMADFAAGGIDVLVATTVIEVGVDVPNATVMLIREAENFGVSQLHQLRGRVGRGGHASLCLFHTLIEDELHPTLGRLQAIAQTSDGFRLAEIDLLSRQEGDVLGTSQSGRERKVKLLSFIEDLELIEQANRDAAGLVAQDRELAQRLVTDIAVDNQEYLEKS